MTAIEHPAARRGEGGRHVLVAYATAHGATQGVAERLAGVLRHDGLGADVRRVEEAVVAPGHEAVVLGSPVYDQRWLPAADAFVRDNLGVLAGRRVWLFSVGTFGDGRPLLGAIVRREPRGIAQVRRMLRAHDYRVFAGVIEREQWPPASRLLFRAFGGRFGDNRDWAAIDGWAHEIARALRPPAGGATR